MTIAARVRRGAGEALATPALRRLETAWLVSSAGGWAFTIALSIYAYGHGGAAAVGLTALTRMLPAGLAAPFTGVLGDHRSRRNVLVGACALRGLTLAAAAAVVAAGGGLAVVLALTALFTAAATAHKPAQAALLPTLTRTPRQLAASNALWSAIDNGGFVSGSLLGGVLMASTGAPTAFAATAAAFGVAALLMAGVPADPVPEHRAAASRGAPARELLLGIDTVAREPALRVLVSLLAVVTLVEGAIDVMVVVVAIELVGTGTLGVGWLNACWGLGGVAGGVAALALLGHGRLASGLAAGVVMVAAALLSIGLLPFAAVAAAALVVLGVGYALVEVAGLTLLQRLASDIVLARAFAVVESTYWLATGTGAILAPVLIAFCGIRAGLAVAAAVLLVVVAGCWRTLAAFEPGASAPERQFGLLRGVPLFAVLPLAAVEALAARLVAVPLRAGQTIVREGHEADRLLVVAEGELTIERGGVSQATAGPGACFGELGLLRGNPHAASVTANGPGLAFALDGAAFVDAVSRDPRCLIAAERLTEAAPGV